MKKKKVPETYKKFAEYYDLYVGDFKDDLNVYSSFCEKDDKILEVGCGTGRVLKHLLNKGLTNITGVDTSEEMLTVAQKKLNKYLEGNILTLKKHDFTKIPLQKGFDKAFITFYTFNYIINKPDKFLRNIYLSMANNSLIIIDLFYPRLFSDPESDNIWKESEFKTGANKVITIRDKRVFDGEFEERVQVFVEGDRTTTIETCRKYYSREEVKKLLHDANFRKIKFIHGYSLGDSSNTDEDYPLLGYNEFNLDSSKYKNREEAKSNFVVYAHKYQ
jgi:ubiquinone/menaquinone biosynthesis C-methylase UbiE